MDKMIKEDVLIYTFKKGMVRYIILEFFAMTFLLVFDVISPYIYKVLIDQVIMPGAIEQLLGICFLMFTIFIIRYIVKALKKREEMRYEHSVQVRLRKRLMEFFLNAERLNRGECIQLYDEYVTRLSESVRKHILEGLFNLLTIGVMACITLVISVELFAFSVFAITCSFGLNYLYTSKITAIMEEYRKKQAKSDGWLISLIRNLEGIKGLSHSKYLVNRCGELEKKKFSVYKREKRNRYFLEIVQDFNYRFVMEMSLYFLGGYMILKGHLLLGSFLAFLSYMKKLYGNIRQLGKRQIDYKKEKIERERIRDALRRDNKPGKKVVENIDIKFDKVSFRYDDKAAFSLNVEELEIGKGSYMAITGESGCGKSTLAKLIAQETENYAGKIAVFQGEIQYDYRDVQIECIHVEKEPYLFNLSALENLLLIDERKERVQKCLELCFSTAEIEELGLLSERVIGEKGSKLSGGQRERLNVVRVLLAAPELVIWDEAMAQMDTVLENAMYEVIKRELRGNTNIFISHRKEIFAHVDRVIRIQNGNTNVVTVC